METSEYSDVALRCGIPNCNFEVSIPDKTMNQLPESDLILLNKLIDPDSEITVAESVRLHDILGHDIVCPLHCRRHLGFRATQKITYESPTYIIGLDSPE